MSIKNIQSNKSKISPQERLLKEVVNQILEHPETWDQKEWHGRNSCGTTHCVAGWTQIKSGKPVKSSTARSDAQAALALADYEADWLFAGERSLSDIYLFAEHFSCDGFDRDGFDRDGFNRSGYDRSGFDRAGFDRACFDRAGFDRAGFGFDFTRNSEKGGRNGLILVPFVL